MRPRGGGDGAGHGHGRELRVPVEEGVEVVELRHDPVDLLARDARVDGGRAPLLLLARHHQGGEPDGAHQPREVQVQPVVLGGEEHLGGRAQEVLLLLLLLE